MKSFTEAASRGSWFLGLCRREGASLAGPAAIGRGRHVQLITIGAAAQPGAWIQAAPRGRKRLVGTGGFEPPTICSQISQAIVIYSVFFMLRWTENAEKGIMRNGMGTRCERSSRVLMVAEVLGV